MKKRQKGKLTALSQHLRKEMTEEERHLWFVFLKQLPFTIKRQRVIGPYIADFYCAEKKTVIELDGSQHFEKKGEEKDRERDAFMRKEGITVLRYSNYQVNKHFTGVCRDILNHLDPDGNVYRQWENGQDDPKAAQQEKQ